MTPAEDLEIRLQGAMESHRAGRLAEAEALYRQILEADSDHLSALYLLGVIASQVGQYATALELTDKAIRVNADIAEVHHNRGNALNGLGQYQAALESFNEAIRLKLGSAEIYTSRAFALCGLQRYAEAVDDYDRAIGLKPESAEVFHRRGVALISLVHHEAALASFDQAVLLHPAHAEAYCNRGIVLHALGRYEAAVESCDKAIVFRPDFAEAHFNRGNSLHALKRTGAALESYDRAILLKPDYADAYFNRATVFESVGQHLAALQSFDRDIELNPSHAEGYNNRGTALQGLLDYEAALTSYNRAVSLKPDFAEAHSNRMNVLLALNRHQEALESCERLAIFKPDYEWLPGMRVHLRRTLCDWAELESECQKLEGAIGRGEKAAVPFTILAASDSPRVQRQAAEIYAREKYPTRCSIAEIPRRRRPARLRIGYFSADYYDHATSYLMAELLERHDRNRFEILGFSFGPEVADEMRRRVSAAMDRFLDVRTMPDREIAQLSRELEVDIAVDLKGFTRESRPGIFAERAAPIQVNYLGYPGTMGAAYMDYLIADRTVIPAVSERYYSEKIVYLPDSYQPNDSRRVISAKLCTRAEEGLPETAFVYCCFNGAYKLTPSVFDGWMRILGRVPDSVLWLLEDNAWAAGSLRKEAARRGIARERLIFAKPLPLAEHLARVRLADLFLDTFPYNAHTTASDALWAGLPVLTRTGETFASRVGASLLRAVGLPELVAATEAAFEELAVELAQNPERGGILRQRLQQNRLTSPLFDCGRFTGHLEAAFTAMYERWYAGLPPERIRIPHVVNGDGL